MPDIRTVLRTYAILTGLAGIIIGLSAPWLGTDISVRVFAALLIGTGCWAGTLSRMDDPALRRTALLLFAAAHFTMLFVVHNKRFPIWRPLTSRVELAMSVEFLAVLSMVIYGERDFMETTRRERATGELAIEPLRSRYEQQIHRAGAQEERNRLARDLHDSVKQQIFIIQTAAATAQARFDADQPGAALAIEQVRSAARDAMTEMEVMMDQLRSVPLENSGLIDALRRQCEALGHRTGAQVQFVPSTLPPDKAMAPGAHQAILRVAQEACANIGRHARAKNVVVSLAEADKSVGLRIKDDGAGFDPYVKTGGMGIANMRSRARELGGSCFVNSRPGDGTTVTFSVPVMPPRRDGYRMQAVTHLLLIGVIGAAAVLYVPRRERLFAVAAWGIALTIQIVRDMFHWAEKD